MRSKLELGGVMMIMFLGLMFHPGLSRVSADEQKKEGDVQERGVSPKIEGVIVQGDQLRAAPGYVLEKGANNQMMARHKAGGGPTMSLNCGCVQGTGSCHPTVSGGFGHGGPSDVAVCAKSPNGPCSGQCGWTWAPTKVEPSRGR